MKAFIFHIAIIFMSCLLISCNSLPKVHADAQTVEVYRSDGSKQCELGSGVSLLDMHRTLIDADIAVISSRRDQDCMMRPALCGAGTSAINVYEIEQSNLSNAQGIGFFPLSRLKARCGN